MSDLQPSPQPTDRPMDRPTERPMDRPMDRQSDRGMERRSMDRRGEDRGKRGQALTVFVDDRGIEAALRVFKKLVIKEGLLKDIKRHEHYEKPGDRKRRKTREAIRRRRRQAARTRGRE